MDNENCFVQIKLTQDIIGAVRFEITVQQKTTNDCENELKKTLVTVQKVIDENNFEKPCVEVRKNAIDAQKSKRRSNSIKSNGVVADGNTELTIMDE